MKGATIARLQAASVPCNGCTACCQNELLMLHPEFGDNPREYLTQKAGAKDALQQKENGDCIYLGKQGCTIWERRPAMCREFDCRRDFLITTRRQRQMLVQAGFASQKVYNAGKKRIHTLSHDERQKARKGRRSDEEFSGLLGAVVRAIT